MDPEKNSSVSPLFRVGLGLFGALVVAVWVFVFFLTTVQQSSVLEWLRHREAVVSTPWAGFTRLLVGSLFGAVAALLLHSGWRRMVQASREQKAALALSGRKGSGLFRLGQQIKRQRAASAERRRLKKEAKLQARASRLQKKEGDSAQPAAESGKKKQSVDKPDPEKKGKKVRARKTKSEKKSGVKKKKK